MIRVIYIIGRTDGKPSVHDLQFIRETPEIQLRRFITTSLHSAAKRFKTEIEAMRFLSRTNPTYTLQERNPADLDSYCYEILIIDSTAVKDAMARGRQPQSLKGSPWALRVFCATLTSQSASSASLTSV